MVRGGGIESVIGRKEFMLVVGGNTVGAWLLSVIAIMGWVGMEVVGGGAPLALCCCH